MSSLESPAPSPGWLGRLDPLVKGAWLVVLTVAVFAIQRPIFPLSVALLAGLGLLTLGRSERAPRLRPLVVLTLALFAIQVLFVREGSVLLCLLPVGAGALPVTDVGLARGAYVAGRILAVLLLSYLYVRSTDPNDLAQALMRAGLPYRYGFALIVALRLLPALEIEANTVYHAQLMRGVRYDDRGPRRLFLLARQLLFPLVVSVLGRVDALAVSMEGRCFGRSPRRTFWRERRRTRGDSVALAALPLAIGTGVWLAEVGRL